MRKLHHWWLCPLSRKVRIQLGELKIPFELKLHNPWDLGAGFLVLNPAGTLPVFEDQHGIVVSDSQTISEYLDENYTGGHIGKDPLQRAETRRMVAWFDQKFYTDVWHSIVFEKSLKSKFGIGNPDSTIIREGIGYLVQHLAYFNEILGKKTWLCGDEMTLADISGAAHLSCIDYLGHVPWKSYPVVYDWYTRMKSRPSLRPLLKDRLPAIAPTPHYTNLDF